MADTETGVKKYVVRLSAEQRKQLESIVSAGKRSTHLVMRARTLLKADVSEAGEGWSDSQIAKALDASPNTVANVRRQLVEEAFEATLSRKYNPKSAANSDAIRPPIPI